MKIYRKLRMQGPFGKWCLAALASLLAFLCLELLLRAFCPLHTVGGVIGLYQYDEELGDRLRPGVHFLRTTDHQEEVYTNELGTANFQETFAPYEKMVFAVGDSYTQGAGLPADASYPFQLDLKLNLLGDVYQQTYGIVNMGLSSYGLEQALICLRRYADLLGKPGYILYLGCDNDYVDDIEFQRGHRHRHLTEGNPHWGIWLRPLQWLNVNSEVGKRLKFTVRNIQRRRQLGSWKRQSPERQRQCPAALEAPALDRLLEASSQLGATLVVSWADIPEDLSSSYYWLREWAHSHNVRFSDWYGRVQSVCKAIDGLPTENPHSGGHHRTWVNTMIAAAFADQIHTSDHTRNISGDGY